MKYTKNYSEKPHTQDWIYVDTNDTINSVRI